MCIGVFSVFDNMDKSSLRHLYLYVIVSNVILRIAVAYIVLFVSNLCLQFTKEPPTLEISCTDQNFIKQHITHQIQITLTLNTKYIYIYTFTFIYRLIYRYRYLHEFTADKN